MTLKDITTDKTLVDVHSPTLIEDMSSILPGISEFDSPIPIIDICRYIILMYDVNSPMLREVRTYYERKARTAEMLQFPTAKGQWIPEVEEMLIGRNSKFNDLVATYISNLGLPQYMQLVAYQEIQRQKMMEVFMGRISDKSDQILERVTTAISVITRQLFGSGEEDEITVARKALYQRAQIDKSRLIPKPEEIVHILETDGELPEDFNPYGEGYEVKQSEFIGDVDPQL
jgi:hypothetical protein